MINIPPVKAGIIKEEKTVKRFYALMALLLVLLVPLFTACTTTPAPSAKASEQATATVSATTAASTPEVQAPVKLSVFIDIAPDVTLENNKAVKFIEDKTNLILEFVKAETPEAKQLALSSGNYPDCYLTGGFSNLDIMNYGVSQKIFIPLNSLIDKLGTEFKKIDTTDVPGYLKMATAPDGNIYGMPSVAQCYHCQSGKSWINVAWLKKLGLNMPQTTDDLYNVLKAFKTQDPNGNGKADEIPMSGAINTWKAEPENWIMNAFIYTDNANYFKVDGGKVSFVANTPEWREGLRYISKLYKEGLIDPAAFTQNQDQLMQLGQNKDTAILGSFAAGHLGMSINLEDRARSEQYDVLLPVKGPGGQQNAQFSDMMNVKGAEFVITNKCKDTEAAFRLGNFAFSEECYLRMAIGVEGSEWEKAKPGDMGLFDTPAKWTRLTNYEERSTKTIDYTLKFALMETFDMRNSWTVKNQDIYDPAAMNYELRLAQATMKYKPYWPKETLPPMFFDADTASKIAQYQTSINDYVKQSTVRFITGELNIETGWDEYVKGVGNLGLADYLAIYQTGLDARVK